MKEDGIDLNSESSPDFNFLRPDTVIERVDKTPDPRTRIDISTDDIGFVTMHNLLYYLYTGMVNLHYGDTRQKLPQGYPEEANASELFRVADMYGVGPLADRCFNYLMSTNTPENICGRLFDFRCEPYQNLRDAYINFLLPHYSEVKDTEGWKELFLKMQYLTDEETKYRASVLLEITDKLAYAQ